MTKKFNDYKSHTVTRGETTQTICFRYGILESDLVLANPNIPLAKYGNGFFGPSTYKLDIKAGDNLRIPFYNEEKDKSGVKSIKGKSTVKVGVWENYKVAEWYAGTPLADRNETKVKWNLYYLKNGAAPEKVLEKEEGKIRFQEKAAGNKYKVVGYLHEPELNNASAKLVSVEPAEKREILNIKLSDVNNKPINKPLAYGNYVNVHVETTGMKGEYLYISLWEDDANGRGHSDTNKHNLVSEGKVLVGNKGVAHKQFVLKADFKKIANAYLSEGDSDEGSTHEYYVTAYASGESKASPNINVRNPDYQEKRQTEKQEHLSGNASTPQTENNTNRSTNPGGESTTTATQIESTPITVDTTAIKVEVAESTTVAKVADSNTTVTAVEALVDAYFAKEEFKKETSEAAGQHTYTFQSNNNNIDKDKVAGIIKKRVDEKIKSDKKYAKLEDIKNVLTKTSYKKGDNISINLYKLGPEYIKINNAPLEEEVYVVAKTVNLDGKEVIIKIKEKVSIILANDADLNVLEAKENGNEITTLKATAEKGIAKVKIKLRPKSDDDLKTWKEKLKGIKDGTHTYTFGGDGNKTKTDEEKKKIAGIILKKVNESLSGQKKFAKAEDIQKALVNEVYNKGEQITFDVYKEVTEYLWLKAECTGEVKKHEGEYLKREGAYFMVGKKCECEARIRAFLRMLRVGEGTGELIKSFDKKTKQDVYIEHDFEKGYTTAFGGNHIDDLSDHPRINYGGSTASGAYQVMGYTWDDNNFSKKRKDYGINSFSEEDQDKFAILLLKEHPGCSQLIDLIIKNKTEKAIRDCASRIWASLPEKGDNSRYLFKGEPQPVTPMKTILEHYEIFLKDELNDVSKLHLKKGFLKDFGIKCNCGKNESSIEWHQPLDVMELRGWYSDTQWSPGKSDYHGRTDGKHDGLDLYAPVGTTIYASIDGTITYLEDPGGYGNRIFLEGTYKDQKYYLMYCHLSEYKTGEVSAGDPIGKTGQTGNANGQPAKMAHLHFEVRKEKMSKPSFDPLIEITELGTGVNKNPDQNKQTGQ